MSHSLRIPSVAVLLALFVTVSAHVHGQKAAAQAQPQAPHHPGQETVAAQGAATPEERQSMMKQNMMQMMDGMKGADAKLDALVQAMNAAKGAEKTDAIAAVVTALVEQHRAMCSSMGMMMNMPGKMGTPPSPEADRPKP